MGFGYYSCFGNCFYRKILIAHLGIHAAICMAEMSLSKSRGSFLVHELVKMGQITEQQARNHPQKYHY